VEKLEGERLETGAAGSAFALVGCFLAIPVISARKRNPVNPSHWGESDDKVRTRLFRHARVCPEHLQPIDFTMRD
jgi:hypothetical protein